MFEAPDKRVWYMFVPLLAVTIVFVLTPPESMLSMALEPVLYLLYIVFALVLGVLGFREGHSLLRPSITVDDQPVLYWLEVGVGCFLFAAIGAWSLFKLVGGSG